MESWVIYAILSMLFAGITSVLAKPALQNISADTGLGIRTLVIAVFLTLYLMFGEKLKSLPQVGWKQWTLLSLSGITAALSWLFYFRAIKTGELSTVTLIDKGSIVITLLLSWLILNENFGTKTLLGAALILAGILVMILP